MLKEQQLKKIKAKQKRLQGILGLTDFADEANEVENEEDEGMCRKRLKVLFYFVMPFFCLKLFCKVFASKEINFSGWRSRRVKNTYSVHLQICKSWHIHVGSFKKWMLICVQLCRDG